MDVFAEQRQDVFRFGVAPEHRFREEQFTVEVNVEDATRPGNDLDSVDHVLPLLEDARDQTGRVGQRTSGYAVLDPDTMSRGHRSIVVSWDSCRRRGSTRIRNGIQVGLHLPSSVVSAAPFPSRSAREPQPVNQRPTLSVGSRGAGRPVSQRPSQPADVPGEVILGAISARISGASARRARGGCARQSRAGSRARSACVPARGQPERRPPSAWRLPSRSRDG
jgi:hypothetical protein